MLEVEKMNRELKNNEVAMEKFCLPKKKTFSLFRKKIIG
jgi:hypothetical protein